MKIYFIANRVLNFALISFLSAVIYSVYKDCFWADEASLIAALFVILLVIRYKRFESINKNRGISLNKYLTPKVLIITSVFLLIIWLNLVFLLREIDNRVFTTVISDNEWHVFLFINSLGIVASRWAQFFLIYNVILLCKETVFINREKCIPENQQHSFLVKIALLGLGVIVIYLYETNFRIYKFWPKYYSFIDIDYTAVVVIVLSIVLSNYREFRKYAVNFIMVLILIKMARTLGFTYERTGFNAYMIIKLTDVAGIIIFNGIILVMILFLSKLIPHLPHPRGKNINPSPLAGEGRERGISPPAMPDLGE